MRYVPHVVMCLLFGTLATGQSSTSDSWLSQVRLQLRMAGEMFEEEGYELTHEVYTGSLRDGQSETVTLTLVPGPGPYRIVGVCDRDCSDLDLVATDLYGDVIDRDVLDDDQPILVLNPRTRMRYRIRVSMANCSASPCFYGVGVFGVLR